ncbi:ARMC5 family protein [Megaselia abdita]
MNGGDVKNLLDIVKNSTDRNVTLRALVKLRTFHVKDRSGIIAFRESDGILPMVKLLHKPYEKILETALSILGNCCTDSDSCKIALDHKILNPLSTVLKSIPNPLIQCRACRLLGNLAKDYHRRIVENHSAVLAQALALILGETEEHQTRVMALRACKLLTREERFLEDLLHTNGLGILMKILVDLMKVTEDQKIEEAKPETPSGLKVNQHREKYFEEVARNLEGVRSDIFDIVVKDENTNKGLFRMPEDKDNLGIVVEILKILQTMSEFQLSLLVKELNKNALGLSCVVFFADDKNVCRGFSLKILSNFSKNFAAFEALSSASAILSACELLTSSSLENPLTESEMRHCINIICLLAGDACNRAKIRRSGSLRKLLNIAKTSKSTGEISLILFALNHFQYDNMSMDLLIKDGLVGFLVNELDSYLKSDDEHKKRKCEEKKKVLYKRKPESQLKPANTKVPRLLITDILDIESPDSSPDYSIPSPCSSRSISPNNKSRHLYAMSSENYDENDAYSPVCSDDEEDIEDEEVVPSPFVDENSKDLILDENCEKEPDDEQSNTRMPDIVPNSALDVIENLMYRVTLLLSKHSELGKFHTMNTIIEAIKMFGCQQTMFSNTLTNILSESQFFSPIIKQGIVHKIYEMSKIKERKQCAIGLIDTLTCVGESGYGQGELVHLLKCDETIQKQASIAVAIIIKTPRLLYHLLADQGCLYTLINTILHKKDVLATEAADALTCLAKTLDLTLPVDRSENKEYSEEFDESMDFPIIYKENASTPSDPSDEMKFVIHRGCSQTPIKFNKRILTDYNNIFSSMLNGNFREGKDKEIHLKDEYTTSGIKFFLKLIDSLRLKSHPKIPPVYQFDSLLQSYDLSMMYMMHEMEDIVLNMIIYRLDETNCLQTLQWSLKKMNQKLSEIAVNVFLSIDCDGLKKVQLYQEADFSDIATMWNDMMVDAVLVKCQNLCVNGGYGHHRNR